MDVVTGSTTCVLKRGHGIDVKVSHLISNRRAAHKLARHTAPDGDPLTHVHTVVEGSMEVCVPSWYEDVFAAADDPNTSLLAMWFGPGKRRLYVLDSLSKHQRTSQEITVEGRTPRLLGVRYLMPPSVDHDRSLMMLPAALDADTEVTVVERVHDEHVRVKIPCLVKSHDHLYVHRLALKHKGDDCAVPAPPSLHDLLVGTLARQSDWLHRCRPFLPDALYTELSAESKSDHDACKNVMGSD